MTGNVAVAQIDRYSREYSISPLKALERLVEDGLLHPIEKTRGITQSSSYEQPRKIEVPFREGDKMDQPNINKYDHAQLHG